jgi:hypothetical protein
MECSGQGTCDRALGICNCYAGFTGDACQRSTSLPVIHALRVFSLRFLAFGGTHRQAGLRVQ